jgi:dephospho-CoA kinase
VVVDADRLAREAVAPGTAGLEAVRSTFGDRVIRDGELDRAALRRIVFANPEARERLEAIVHPEVERLRRREETRLEGKGVGLVVHEIPLLFEAGLEEKVDLVVLVDAPAEVRVERIVRDRGLEQGEARAMVGAQMPASEKRGRADIIIDNVGSMESLKASAATVWEQVQRIAGSEADEASAGAGGAADVVGTESPPPRVRVDMHIHTRVSYDCRSEPEAVIERALAAGLGRICITDHDEVEAALQLAERYPDRVIPGEEIKTAEGVDVIGLYLSEWIPRGTPAREACRQIREQGGIVYVPHPFAGGKGGGGRVLAEIEELVQIVEGFNARLHRSSLNERARAWARERGLPVGAGSDAHTLGEIGNAWVELPAFENSSRGLLEAIGDGRIHGTEAPLTVHLASTLAKFLP